MGRYPRLILEAGFQPGSINNLSSGPTGIPPIGKPDPEARLNDRAAQQLALEPDTAGPPDVSAGPVWRAVKVVGDVLWWSFLMVIFASITVGVATELFL